MQKQFDNLYVDVWQIFCPTNIAKRFLIHPPFLSFLFNGKYTSCKDQDQITRQRYTAPNLFLTFFLSHSLSISVSRQNLSRSTLRITNKGYRRIAAPNHQSHPANNSQPSQPVRQSEPVRHSTGHAKLHYDRENIVKKI